MASVVLNQRQKVKYKKNIEKTDFLTSYVEIDLLQQKRNLDHFKSIFCGRYFNKH